MGGVSNHEEHRRQRIVFASALIAFGNTLHAHLESASQLRVVISAKIVEYESADLLFHHDDIEEVIQKHAMALFKK